MFFVVFENISLIRWEETIPGSASGKRTTIRKLLADLPAFDHEGSQHELRSGEYILLYHWVILHCIKMVLWMSRSCRLTFFFQLMHWWFINQNIALSCPPLEIIQMALFILAFLVPRLCDVSFNIKSFANIFFYLPIKAFEFYVGSAYRASVLDKPETRKLLPLLYAKSDGIDRCCRCRKENDEFSKTCLQSTYWAKKKQVEFRAPEKNLNFISLIFTCGMTGVASLWDWGKEALIPSHTVGRNIL